MATGSLLGSLYTATMGVNAQSTKFGTISDNIANVRTNGYKANDTQFATLVAGRQPYIADFFTGGVIPNNRQLLLSQGVLKATESSTDIGISGKGFYAVAARGGLNTESGTRLPGTDVLNTRAGSFQIDKDGYMVNVAGFALMGEKLTDADITNNGGNIPDVKATSPADLVPVRFDSNPDLTITGQATTVVRVEANIPATDAVGTARDIFVQVYDSAGATYDVNLKATKTAINTWAVAAVSAKNNASDAATVTVSPVPTIFTFNSDGSLASPTGPQTLGSFAISNGSTMSPQFNFTGGAPAGGKLTQIGDVIAVTGASQDGYPTGARAGIVIDANGVVKEQFTNGVFVTRFRIPIVDYINAPGLEARSGNVWATSETSGTPVVGAANGGSNGLIQAQTLEDSTVDLSNEFAEMIVTQRAYSANTKTLTTADEMYKTVVQMKN